MITKGYTAFDLFTIDRIEEYRYVEVDGGVKVIGYSGLREYIEIPEEINGKKVVAIGVSEERYPGSMGFKILVPNTVTYIDPKSTPIASDSWYKELYVKSDNENFLIEDNILYSKDKKTLYLGLDESIENPIITEEVEHIGEYAFFGYHLESLSLPPNLKSIGSHAFATGFLKIEVPRSVENIGDNIAKQFTVSKDNKFYKYDEEDGCIYSADGKVLIKCTQRDIKQVVIADTVEVIRPYAFSGLRINKLDLGSGVKEIGENAFYDAEIKTIRIPDQVTKLGEHAFGCKKCNSIRVSKNNKNFYSDGICLYEINDNDELCLLTCYKAKEEEYEIPEGVTRISPTAFRKCENLERLSLPESLKSFDESCLPLLGVYGGPDRFSTIEIPENVTDLNITLDVYDFKIKEGNQSYFIEDNILYHRVDGGLEIISAKEIKGELILKEGVIAVKANAFSSCKKITKVICNPELKVIEHNGFTDGMSAYALKEVVFNEGIEYVDYLSFAKCKVNTIILPSTLEYICVSAFYDCETAEYDVDADNAFYTSVDGILYNKKMSELKIVPKHKEYSKFVIPSGVCEIGRAFYKCKYVSEIVIPNTVTCIWRNSLSCSAKDVYFEGDIKVFNYTGLNLWNGTKIHADAGTGAVQYFEWIKSQRSDVKMKLAINGEEDISALSEDFDITINESGITIVKAIKEDKIINVPEKIGEYPVTKIGARAFQPMDYGNDSIEEIIIPDTVKEISDYAFEWCRALKNVKLPSMLKKISIGMFSSCEALEEVIIPEGVEEVCGSAFFGCRNIKKIYFPTSITKISDWFLSDSKGNFKDLYLSAETVFVVEQGSYAEKYLREYKTDGYNCERLFVVYKSQLSNSDTEDEKEALKYLEYTIEDNGSLSVHFKRYGAQVPVNGRIPASIHGMPVTKLSGNRGTLYMPDNMKTLYIPESVIEIQGLDGFSFYTSGTEMRGIEVAEENANYWSDGKALYSKDKSRLIHMFDYKAEKYEVNSETRIIEASAFANFYNLKTVILPEGLQEVKANAFYSCSKLESIIGIENVPLVANGAINGTIFYGSQNIIFSGTVLHKYNDKSNVNYEIPALTTEIANNAFVCAADDDVLETVAVPSSVSRIGAEAFRGRKKLKNVVLSEGLVTIDHCAFKSCTALEMIYIPASVKEISTEVFPVYESYWNNTEVPVFSRIDVDSGNSTYKSIDGILYSKDGKSLLTVPSNLQMTEINVPDGVENICELAFYANQNIKKVILPDSVKIIERSAFYECTNLEYINLEHVEIIGKSSFRGCKNIKTLILENAQTIGASAFNECGIAQVSLPDGLKIIEENAFAQCPLKEVSVPKTVLKTGYQSFSGCPEITIYDTIDPEAKPCEKHLDDLNGFPNSEVGFIGIGRARAMWECAANHVWLDYEIIVRNAETDEIKYKVWMGADSKNRKYYCTLSSSWGKNGTFNFRAVDNIFKEIKGTDNKLKVAVNRLRYPEMLSDVQRDVYIAYLVRSAKELVTKCIDNDDMDTLLFCEKYGVIKKNNIDFMLDYAGKNGAVQFSAYFMDYKNKNFGGASSKAKLPTLSMKVESPWTISKSVSGKVGRYKGEDIEVEFPLEVNGKKVTGIAGTTSKVPDNYKNIVSVILPEGYTSIGDYAFYGCVNLEKIVLPNTLKTIGKDAFNGCEKLKEVIMPDSVIEIGPNAFRRCSSLSVLRLSKKMSDIPGYAFGECTSLKVIDLPANIIRLDKGAFDTYVYQHITVHCPKLMTTGKCFSFSTSVKAYEGAVKGVYGIRQSAVQRLYVYDIPSKTYITVSLVGTDNIYNFSLPLTDSSIQAVDKVKVNSVEGLISMLESVYGDGINEENNEAQMKSLSSADILGATGFEVTEDKMNDDGMCTTVLYYDFSNHEKSIAYTETIGSVDRT